MNRSFFRELSRRNVFRVAAAYVVLAWLMAQVAEFLLVAFDAPPWTLRAVVALFLVGFPIVVFLAWAFELTPEGVKREREVDRDKSITRHTGRKLDRALIVLLLLAVGWFAWNQYRPDGAKIKEVSVAERNLPDKEVGATGDDAVPIVAVLPFKAMGSDDSSFLAAGLHDDLLTRLAKLDVYRVISRTSVMEYADTTKNMRQIGQELGAGYILEGGVQAVPGRVRINAQLIAAAHDEHLWAEVYDRAMSAENLFDVQAELAVAIANALHTELSPSDQTLVDEVPTQNLEAYNAYLRGRQLGRRTGYVGTPEDHESVVAFEEAVALDPGFAEAWARLATARIKAATDAGYSEESSGGVLAALGRARELKPGMLESELAWAEYQYRFLKEYALALETLDGLGARAASNTEALELMAFLNRRLGRFEEAYDRMQQALDLSPRDPSILIVLTHYAWMIDDCVAAGKYADSLRDLAPDWPAGQVRVAEYEIECNGNIALANEIYKGLDYEDIGFFAYAFWAAMHGRDTEWVMRLIEWDDPFSRSFDEVWDEVNAAQAYRYLLQDEEAVAVALSQAEELLTALATDPQERQNSYFPFLTASVYSMRGDAENAVIWLEEFKRLFEEESKGDVAERARWRFGVATVLTQAGLYDEAVEELRIMLEQPGGYRFPVVDGFPVFEALEHHPGFVALREHFGKQGSG